MKKIYLLTLLLISTNVLFAQRDDKGLNFGNRQLPATLQNIASWELIEAASDDFNYANKQNTKFGNTWQERYNPDPGFVGPGQTRWNVTNAANFRNDVVTLNNGSLEIRAFPGGNNSGGRRNFTDRFVRCGIVSSRNTVKYPVYMEARIQISNLENSSNFWMLNACDNEEIDVLECYGGAKNRNANGDTTNGDSTFFTTQMSTNQHIWHRQGVQDHGGETDNCGGRDLTDFTYQVFFTTSAANSNAPVSNWRDSYHTFGVYWASPTEITYFIDGVPRSNGRHFVANRAANELDGSFEDARMQCPNPAVLRCETSELLRNVQGRASGGSAFPNRQFNDPTFLILDTESHSGRPLESVQNLNNNNLNAMRVDWVRTYRPTFNTPMPPVVVNPNPPTTPTPTPDPNPNPDNGGATNLALSGTSTQSSNLGTSQASLANNGDTSNFSHTQEDANAWWEIDLGSRNNISHINVWNRTDCCTDRLQNYQIFVSDVPFASKDIVETANQNNVGVYFQEAIALRPTRQNIGRTGRYVRLQLAGINFLNISEVEIFGTPIANQILPNGLYHISSQPANQNLLARSIENQRARIIDNADFADQRWTLQHQGNNIYTIRNQGTNRFLEVPASSCVNGAIVQTSVASTGNNRRWSIQRNGTNFSIRPAHCLTRALDLIDGARNGNVQIFFANNSNNNQKWNINRVAGSKIIDQNTTKRSISVYPNPVDSDLTNFTVEGLSPGQQINILDSNGKLVKQLYATTSIERINTSNMSTGLYFISVDYSKKVTKLIVE